MFKSINDFYTWLAEQHKFGMHLGLDRIKAGCSFLGDPQNEFKSIHIGGTNGKGSTVTYLKSMLMESGLNVGTFISPFIIEFNERITLNNNNISDDELIECANSILPAVNYVNTLQYGNMTEFEIITLLSFVYFSKVDVDIVLYEVGLGGTYDSTNVIMPILSVITNIGVDHVGVLGNTKAEIAYQKLGIVKEGISLITSEKDDKVLKLFKGYCEEKDSQLVLTNEANEIEYEINDTVFSYRDLKDLRITMTGVHQIKNASLAIEVIKYLQNKRVFNIRNEYIYRGLKKSFWPGRFEIINNKPLIILDGAHNVDGIEALIKTVKELNLNKIKVIFSALKDKETKEMSETFLEITNYIHFTSFDFPRAKKAIDLYEEFTDKDSARYTEEWELCIKDELNNIKEDEVLIVTGSLYFIANVRKYLINSKL